MPIDFMELEEGGQVQWVVVILQEQPLVHPAIYQHVVAVVLEGTG